MAGDPTFNVDGCTVLGEWESSGVAEDEEAKRIQIRDKILITEEEEIHSLSLEIHPNSVKLDIPWNLARVCSRWRHTVQTDQRLWNNIEVVYNHIDDSPVIKDTAADAFSRSGPILWP